MKITLRRAKLSRLIDSWYRRRKLHTFITYITICALGALSVVLCAWWIVKLSKPPPRLTDSPIRHMPVKYWSHMRMNPDKYRSSRPFCMQPPLPNQVLQVSAFWQRVAPVYSDPVDPLDPEDTLDDEDKLLIKDPTETPDPSDVLIYSAYWDSRNEPVVRIIVYSDKALPTLFCQLWYYSRGNPQTVVAEEYSVDYISEPDKGSRLLSCPCGGGVRGDAPAAVSVTAERCGTAYTMLTVQGAPIPTSALGWLEKPESQRVHHGPAVCAQWPRRTAGAPKTKGDRTDVRVEALKLAEWLFALHAVNLTTIYLYLGHTTVEVYRILEKLSFPEAGLVEITPYTPPPGVNDLAVASDAPFLDCLYRSLTLHEWVVPLDIDHLPIRNDDSKSWEDILSQQPRDTAVVQFDRYWFAEWLGVEQSERSIVPSRFVTVQPDVEFGKVFTNLWRLPQPVPYDAAWGSFVRVSLAVWLGAGSARVEGGEGGGAAVFAYHSRCGRYNRTQCRDLRRNAVRDRSTLRLQPIVKRYMARLAELLAERPRKKRNH